MIRIEDRGRTRFLFLARPEKRNALDRALAEALIVALRAAEEAENVAAVVVAADGPGFCAGADLGEMRAIAGDPDAKAARAVLSEAVLSAPGRIGRPVVAAVHGAAMGAGAALALCCDRVVLADDARLGFPEARHGMLPALMAPALLRHLPPRAVFDLLATGRSVAAEEARALGLADRVVPGDALLDTAAALAEEAATLPPARMRALKRLLAGGVHSLEDGFGLARALREELA